MKQRQAGELLELVRRFVQTQQALPKVVRDNSVLLMELHGNVKKRMGQLLQRMDKSLHPRPGQVLDPQKVMGQIHLFSSQVTGILELSFRLWFEERYWRAQLKEQNSKLRAQLRRPTKKFICKKPAQRARKNF